MQPLDSLKDMRLEQILVGPVEVPGNAAMTIEIISENGPFRAHNMIMAEEDARHFFITDLKVGRNSQLVTNTAIHASFFAGQKAEDNLAFDALPRGMKMSVCVLNMTEEPKTFKAVLRGELYDRDPQGRYPLMASCPFDKIVMGIGHTIVPAHGIATITVQPQVPCKPDRVVIPTYVLDAVRLRMVRVVGNDVLKSELKDGQADLIGVSMKLGDWCCVDVENMTDQPKAFYGAIGGQLVR
jgi:hypothetical protein